jgi:hypothetical protein
MAFYDHFTTGGFERAQLNEATRRDRERNV